MRELQQNLSRHVHTLAADIGERNVFHPTALVAAAEYIQQQWQQQGYEVQRQRYRAKGIDCANLEIVCQGAGDAEDAIVIGAHYDSVHDSPGANDNGSGVAALLELSRLLRNISPQTTLRFVAFVNEEPPFFYWPQMGSMVYAKAARRRGEKIRFMVSLETIGYFTCAAHSQAYPPVLGWFYPDQGNFIAFVANLRSRRVLRQAVRQFRHCSDFPLQHIATLPWLPGVGWSDHLAFWRHGYRAFMITDTAFYRYPYYHSAEDTADKLRYAPFARLTQDLFCTFTAMANT